jgi:anti-anti-sigma regulatory factor
MTSGEARGASTARLCSAMRVEPGLLVVELSGQAGVSTVPVMRLALGRARAVPGVSAVVVVVDSVAFVDPLPVGVLMLEQLAAHEQGREFFVCGVNAGLDQVIAALVVSVMLVRVVDLAEARLLAGAVC